MKRAFLAALLLAAACSSGSSTAGPVPDFLLMDVNDTSPTFDQEVSPRDYLTKVSGWYFGSAT